MFFAWYLEIYWKELGFKLVAGAKIGKEKAYASKINGSVVECMMTILTSILRDKNMPFSYQKWRFYHLKIEVFMPIIHSTTLPLQVPNNISLLYNLKNLQIKYNLLLDYLNLKKLLPNTKIIY